MFREQRVPLDDLIASWQTSDILPDRVVDTGAGQLAIREIEVAAPAGGPPEIRVLRGALIRRLSGSSPGSP